MVLFIIIYLLCNTEIMQKKTRKNTKKERKKQTKKHAKTPHSHTVHTQFTIVCASDWGHQQGSAVWPSLISRHSNSKLFITYTGHHAGRIKSLIIAVVMCWSVRWQRCWGTPGWCCWTTCRRWPKKRHGWTTHWLRMIDRGTCWRWTNHRRSRTAGWWRAEQRHGLTTHWWRSIHRYWLTIGHVWHDGWRRVWLTGRWSQRHISDAFLHTWYKTAQFQHTELLKVQNHAAANIIKRPTRQRTSGKNSFPSANCIQKTCPHPHITSSCLNSSPVAFIPIPTPPPHQSFRSHYRDGNNSIAYK